MSRSLRFEESKRGGHFGVDFGRVTNFLLERSGFFEGRVSGGLEVLRRQHNAVAVVLRIRNQVGWDAREQICLSVRDSRLVSELELETTKVEGPPRLSTTQVQHHPPIFKVPVVSDNLKGVRKTFEIMPPVL